MTDQLYRDIILDHWKNPQNYGVLENPDIDVEGDNPMCGDTIRITLKIKNKIIHKIAFVCEGCAISKSSASLFSEELKGKNLLEVKNIPAGRIIDLLGIKLTPAREKCALLFLNTIQKAAV